jgi:hypothetical protein
MQGRMPDNNQIDDPLCYIRDSVIDKPEAHPEYHAGEERI